MALEGNRQSDKWGEVDREEERKSKTEKLYGYMENQKEKKKKRQK